MRGSGRQPHTVSSALALLVLLALFALVVLGMPSAALADEPVSTREKRLLQETGENTTVIDAFDHDDPFDANLSLAHSHPVGPQAFSREDETTMAALVTALGRPLVFSVVAPRAMVRCTKAIDDAFEVSLVVSEPWWATLLRLASSIDPQAPKEE